MDFIIDDSTPANPQTPSDPLALAKNLLSGTTGLDRQGIGYLAEALATPMTSLGAQRLQDLTAEMLLRTLPDRKTLAFQLRLLGFQDHLGIWPVATRQPDGSWGTAKK